MCLEEVKRNGESEVSTVNIHQYNQHKLARVTVKAFRSSQDDYELVKCRRLLQLVSRILPSVLRCFTHRHTQSGNTVCVICMWANTHRQDAPIQARARQLYTHTERLTLSLTDDFIWSVNRAATQQLSRTLIQHKLITFVEFQMF